MIDLGPFKEVLLTRGKVAKVSPEDYDYVMRTPWFYNGDTSPYAARHFQRDGKMRKVYLHRQLVPTAKGMIVNHGNGDTLDCRRKNLNPTTPRRNSTAEKVKRGKLGYFGVWAEVFVRKNGTVVHRYRASISIGAKRVYLGGFRSPEDAARAYDLAAVDAFGLYADTNFPLTDYLSPVTLTRQPPPTHDFIPF